jgi:transcriptional regulator with GAF, ATPase, and Fis domain
MESEAMFQGGTLRHVTLEPPNGHTRPPATSNKIAALQELAFQLLLELQAVREIQTVNLAGGIDFYEEITRFEIDLIKSALRMTHGNQTRAARLLNLNPTTLNSKIKHYNITVNGYSGDELCMTASDTQPTA